MIRAFEQRFAEVLGSSLPAPFAGRVYRSAPSSWADPAVVLGVREVRPTSEDFGSTRTESVAGLDGKRRVLRLTCRVELTVGRGAGADASQELAGIEGLLYLIDAPEYRTGKALQTPGDSGFAIQRMSVIQALRPASGGSSVLVDADGWFWPIGLEGETGIAIGEIRVRGTALPLLLEGLPFVLRAGDAAVDLALRVSGGFGMRLGSDVPSPIRKLLVWLSKLDGQPGTGVLGGGEAVADGLRAIELGADGRARFSYAPPGAADREQLVVGLDNGAGALGVELGRFLLETLAAVA
jgi:hypothetical protein